MTKKNGESNDNHGDKKKRMMTNKNKKRKRKVLRLGGSGLLLNAKNSNNQYNPALITTTTTMKRCKKLKKIELPDCVMSHIFSMLSLKDLVKTSTMSKRWIHGWGSRMDLNFDLHNMFDYNTIQDLPETLPLFPIIQRSHFQCEFATRIDQFMLHYQGLVIRSIRLDFPLGEDHTDVIDRLISRGIAKGVKRIELLFSFETEYNHKFLLKLPLKPYTFKLTLLSDTDSLTYLHLRNFYLAEPTDFSGLKNLTTIVLDGLFETHINNNLSQLFSKCLQLEDATFKNCKLVSPMKITGPKLRHLNIINCDAGFHSPKMIAIDALNLSSFEFSGRNTSDISVMAPRLLNVFWNAAVREKNQHPFCTIAKLTRIENLAMIISPSQIEKLTKELIRFQNLRQLELFIEGAYDPNMDYFWILDIAMASQHLHKFSLTIRNLHLEEHSHMDGFKRQKRKYAGFSHNNLKYVKFCGCVCSLNVVELASQLLRNASLLKKMTFSSCDKFYIGAGGWTNDVDCCCGFEHNVIYEMLKDEVNEQCRLIIL